MRYAFFRYDVKQVEPTADNDTGGWKGFATKPVVDRVGDIVNPKGVTNIPEFMQNPVTLFNHNVNDPIGKITMLDPRLDGLYDEGRFGRRQGAQDRRMDLEDGIINAQSIGFQPIDSRPIEGEEDARALMKMHGMDFDGLSDKARLAITTEGEYIDKWALFEISLVTVPANPSAQIEFAKSLNGAEKDGKGETFLPALEELLHQLKQEAEADAASDEKSIEADLKLESHVKSIERLEQEIQSLKAGRVLSAKNRNKILDALETTGEARRAMAAAERGLKDVLSLAEPPDKSAGDSDNAPDTSREDDSWLEVATRAKNLTKEVQDGSNAGAD